MSKIDVQQAVTDRVIAALAKGVVPWRVPWTTGGAARSMSTGRVYQGINVWLTSMTAAERGYRSPWWGTFNQIKALGGMVKAGQNRANGQGSTMVVLWNTAASKKVTNDAGEQERRSYLYATSFNVFNADQTEGLPEKYYAQPKGSDGTPIEEAQDIANGYFGSANAPKLFHDATGRAYYVPSTDEIHLPPMADHVSTGEYYSTLFHEAGHSTGHKSRLDRDGIDKISHFGSGSYSREELVAEMTAAMVCAEAGVDTADVFDNSAAYIGSWMARLENDKKLLTQAASRASKAANLIMGVTLLDQEEAS
jgi:antirestriction protein ArdC